MPQMSYDEIVTGLDHMSRYLGEQGGYRVREMFDSPDAPLKVVSYTAPRAFVLLRVSPPSPSNPRTSIEIAGGGAMDARPEPALFHHLVTRHMDFDWGGPFAREWPGGRVTYGSRTVVVSELMTSDNLGAVFGHIGGMINMVGLNARMIATEILARSGGVLLDGASPEHDVELFRALTGQRRPN